MLKELTIDRMLRLEVAVRRELVRDVLFHMDNRAVSPIIIESWVIAEAFAEAMAVERVKKQGNMRTYDSFRKRDDSWFHKLESDTASAVFGYTEKWLRNKTGFPGLSLRQFLDECPDDYDE